MQNLRQCQSLHEALSPAPCAKPEVFELHILFFGFLFILSFAFKNRKRQKTNYHRQGNKVRNLLTPKQAVSSIDSQQSFTGHQAKDRNASQNLKTNFSTSEQEKHLSDCKPKLLFFFPHSSNPVTLVSFMCRVQTFYFFFSFQMLPQQKRWLPSFGFRHLFILSNLSSDIFMAQSGDCELS